MVIKKKIKQERDENLLKETVKKVIFDYGVIISVMLQHILKIYFDDDLEWTSHCSCVLLIASPMKFNSFVKKQDVTGRFGLSPLQKCTPAIRVLAYSYALDAVDEYLRLVQPLLGYVWKISWKQ